MFNHKDFEPSESLGAANKARKKIFSRGLAKTYRWGFLYRVGLFFKMCWETLKAIVFAAIFFLGLGIIIGAVCFAIFLWGSMLLTGPVGVITAIIYTPIVGIVLAISAVMIIELWNAMKPLIFGAPDKNDYEKYEY